MVEGLPLFDGVQLVVDTTLVSPLRGDGSPHPNVQAAKRRKERTYPELVGPRARFGWLSGLVKLVGGGLVKR